MPDLQTILIVTIAGLTLSASPGPSMLYVLSRSIGQDTTAGIASSIGLCIGGILLAILSAFGLSIVVQQSEVLFSSIKIAGACYLIYLGLQIIKSVGKDELKINKIEKDSFSRILFQGILVELLNPKTIIFFIAFLPQFIILDSQNVTLQLLVLGILVPLTAIPSDLIVCFASGLLANKLSKNSRISIFLNCASGLILIGLGIRIFLTN